MLLILGAPIGPTPTVPTDCSAVRRSSSPDPLIPPLDVSATPVAPIAAAVALVIFLWQRVDATLRWRSVLAISASQRPG